jgi:hypothetical protein
VTPSKSSDEQPEEAGTDLLVVDEAPEEPRFEVNKNTDQQWKEFDEASGIEFTQAWVWEVYDLKREKVVLSPYRTAEDAQAAADDRAAWVKTLPEGDVNA